MATIYERNNIRRVVNASGRMTILGVSTISDEVGKTMVEAAQNYVVIEELMDEAGRLVTKHTGAQASCVTNCASSGIMISVAACIAKDNLSLVERMPRSEGLKNEVIIQKGHAVNFGASITQMISMGGGVPVEVGQANKVTEDHIRGAINENTVALFYVKSHHAVQKGMVPIQKMIEIAHQYHLPLIIDAAAEEDLKKYVAMDADLVIYSGAKAFEGPTSGFITGKKEYIAYCRKQFKGVGRPAKVGKESIMGIVKALELYETRDIEADVKKQKDAVQKILEGVKDIDYIKGSMVQDEAGRAIFRARLEILKDKAKFSAEELVKLLEKGNPAIYVRDYYANVGSIDIDTRPLVEGDVEIIVNRLKELR